jgi:hypothetical protein
LEIIAPVLYEMEELDTELGMEDFKLAMRNLARGLNPYQKSLLFSYRYEAKAVRVWWDRGRNGNWKCRWDELISIELNNWYFFFVSPYYCSLIILNEK